MALAPGSRLGPFEILALLGAGGMGEVYRARDASLKRDVAIKVLPPSYSRDPDRLRRFQLEAQSAAALNHTNILSVFYVGQHGDSPYIVSELLEGETLRDRLRRGPMRLREALDVAVAVAHGLAAAHAKGIVHRDLKPENLFLVKDGRVKILDFGLAKLTQFQVTAADDGPTASIQQQTDPGVVMGTVGYMSPEQIRGGPADARSDIFSLGCVLYEMLTGKRAFHEPTYAETMTAILNEDPPALSQIAPTIPPALQRVVRRCLDKNPEQRFQSAEDLAFAMDALSESGSSPEIPAARRRNRERLAWIVAGLAGVLLLASLAMVARMWRKPTESATVRFQIPVPDKLSFHFFDLPAVSPDGERIAFTASASMLEDNRLFVRPLNAATVTEIPMRGYDASLPFWSPDGRQIAFFSHGTVQKVDISGGAPVAICTFAGGAPGGTAGGTWNPDGVIIFSRRPGTLYRVDAANGDPQPLRPLAEGETQQRWPQFLPDGKHYLYLSMSNRPDQQGIYAASLVNGVLAWRRGSNLPESLLQWFDRSGKRLGVVGEAADYSNPALSPDDRRLAIGIRDPQAKTRDIWIFDLLRGTKTRLTFDPADDLHSIWSPDGTRIAFTSDRLGQRDIYQKLADGSGPEELLLGGKDGAKNVEDWSPDGKYLVYNYQIFPYTGLYVLPLAGDRKPVPFVNTQFTS